jgi:hypothetical protein
MIILHTRRHVLLVERNPSMWMGVWRSRDYYGSVTAVCILTIEVVYEHVRKTSNPNIMRSRFGWAWWRLPLLLLSAGVVVLTSCNPSTETIVRGDHDITQVTAGKLNDGDGNWRTYYILRDKDTGVDYLVVVDAGIVKLEKVPKPDPESPR